jgi:multidrug efflux system membrane fusion protein
MCSSYCAWCLLFAVFLVLPACSSEDKNQEAFIFSDESLKDGAILVSVYNSRAQNIFEKIVISGNTESNRDIFVRSQVKGKTLDSNIDKGVFVEEGQVLCKISVDNRKILLESAQAQLNKTRKDLADARKLRKKGYASDSEVLGYDAAFSAGKAGYEQAKLQLKRTEISAPFSGYVEAYFGKKGELLEGGSVCARLVDLNPIKFKGYIAENRLGLMQVGLAAELYDASGNMLPATISFVAMTSEKNIKTYLVEARSENPDYEMRSGLTAKLVVKGSRKVSAHLLSRSALVLNSSGDVGVMLADGGGVARFFGVTIVRDDKNGIWLAGLPDEVSVIVTGQEFVEDGSPVRIDAGMMLKDTKS